MSLPLLAGLVVAGIALVTLIVHWGGGSEIAHLSDEDEAQVAFLEDYPGAKVRGVFITADRTGAILLLAGGEVGIVHAFGHNYVTRHLADDDIGALQRRGSAVIEFQPNDLTWNASPHYIFSSTEDVERIAAALQGQERFVRMGDADGKL